jgi:hypothetical protein
MNTLRCCQTGFENIGVTTAMTLINGVGNEGIANLS